MLRGGVKAGRLRNGLEKGKGKVVHAVETTRDFLYMEASLCGQMPSVHWSQRKLEDVTCPKCLKKLQENADEKKFVLDSGKA